LNQKFQANKSDTDTDSEEEDANSEKEKLPEEKLNNDRLAILCACFHPTQPWLLTSGADGQIALFS
jgi:WD40 repeat protein